VGYNNNRGQYGIAFIRAAVVASQMCEITRNSKKIRTHSASVIQGHPMPIAGVYATSY